MRAILSVMLGAFVTGCAHDAVVRSADLPDGQKAQLVRKAIDHFESNRTAYLAGNLVGLDFSITDSEDFDRTSPVLTEWCKERNVVTVLLPRRMNEWFSIELDAQTGEVKGSSIRLVSYSTPRDAVVSFCHSRGASELYR